MATTLPLNSTNVRNAARFAWVFAPPSAKGDFRTLAAPSPAY